MKYLKFRSRLMVLARVGIKLSKEENGLIEFENLKLQLMGV